ncbi:UxaA family hydrolase [Stappia indica]|uniref:Altronate dehydratase n=1 Tax=Stappia indica TaxID=538381 RepID=A0A857C6K0_9HYPH|nr:altronate dehydratase family protein [Stappia indica]QGZ34509.1 altronate dehydratase [Stappia indica]
MPDTATGLVDRPPLVLSERDNVAVLAARAEAGSDPLGVGAPLSAAIAPGHKIARRAIGAGEPVVKYGQVIGYATVAIAAGTHVHSHNCEIGEHERAYRISDKLDEARAAIPRLDQVTIAESFLGYPRTDGRAGTRNMIALVATVNCSATVVRRAADILNASGMLDEWPNIDGVVAFAHGTGCGMSSSGPGWEILQRVLWGHATHPNVGAAVFVGLGCEVMQVARMKALYSDGAETRFHGLAIQENGGTHATIERIVETVRELLPEVNRTARRPVPVAALKLGLQCGGSDGWSGITANPALGIACDLLVAQGATVVLSETPEIFGAEQLLLSRAASQEVADRLIERIRWWEDYAAQNGASLDQNPSPGNKAGGLTTILEKSLGAVAKAGATPLNEVVGYGEQVKGPGLVFMDTPGYDPVSATGQIAGGCQLVAFTTGRGSAFGSKPAPTLKIATSDRLYRAMREDMDVNAGEVLETGVSLAEKGREIHDRLIAAASGEQTKSEALGLGDHEFVPWQIGAVL